MWQCCLDNIPTAEKNTGGNRNVALLKTIKNYN